MSDFEISKKGILKKYRGYDDNVVIPAGVTSIGNEAFKSKWVKSITIPDSVTSIGDRVFEDCSSLKSITIPASVTSIGAGAFKGCSDLTGITIPASVTEIGDGAFENCSAMKEITVSADNRTYSSADGVLLNKRKTKVIRCPEKKDGAYIIPDSVTSIGGSAFEGCNKLKKVCAQSMEAWLGIKFEGYSSNPCCYGAELYIGDELAADIMIPASVTSIGERAFEDCKSLTSITIPKSVTSIGERAFSGCSSLKSITIPDSVTSIGESAFGYCSSLTSITIPAGVTSIGDNVSMAAAA